MHTAKTRTGHNKILKNTVINSLNNTTVALDIYSVQQHSIAYSHIHPTGILCALTQASKENTLSAGSRFDMLLPSDTAQSVVAAEQQYCAREDRFVGRRIMQRSKAIPRMTDAFPKGRMRLLYPLI